VSFYFPNKKPGKTNRRFLLFVDPGILVTLAGAIDSAAYSLKSNFVPSFTLHVLILPFSNFISTITEQFFFSVIKLINQPKISSNRFIAYI